MTPLEFSHAMAAAHELDVERQERDLAHAWHVVALTTEVQVKGRLPSLKTVLGRMSPAKADPVMAQAAIVGSLQILSRQYGIPMRPMTPETRAGLFKGRDG